jgi:PBP1b-binding outer membrane lipoprotein LpoB
MSKSIILIIFLSLTLASCAKKLEDNSSDMNETTQKLQVQTQDQMNQMIELMSKLEITISSLDRNFEILIQLMSKMESSLEQLAKLSPPIRKMIDSINPILEGIFQDKVTEDKLTEDIDDLI